MTPDIVAGPGPRGGEPGHRGWRRWTRRLGVALAVAGLIVVAVATLTPISDPRGMAAMTPLLCLVCGDQGGADVAANLLLFLPLGIGLRLAGLSWGRTVLACASISFTVELLQLVVVPGRDASLSDLVTNTISGAVGAWVGEALPAAVRPTARHAARLLAGGIVTLILLLSASAWLLQPGTPNGELLSRWAHRAPGRDVFRGRVLSVHLDGLAMPSNGPPPDSGGLRRRLDRGAFTLEAEVVSGTPVKDRSWIYMFRVPGGGVLTLSQLRREAAIAVPARALRFRLWPPILALANGLPADREVPVTLTAEERGRRLRLTSVYGGQVRAAGLTISPAFGWIMIVPFELGTGAGVRWVTGLWLAAFLLLLGYWAAGTGWPPAVAGGTLVAALALALGLVPAAAGLPPVHWSEWLAGTLGAAAGWALRRFAAYLQGRCVSPSESEFSSS